MYVYIYFFFPFLNFNPKNIPGKDVEAGLGLLQRTFVTKDSGLAYSQATPAHFSLLIPGREKQWRWGNSWERARAVVALG